MDWLTEAERRLRRGNRILFTRESPLLQDLLLVMEGTDRRPLVRWALEQAGRAADALAKRYPADDRPARALAAGARWAAGEIKMPEARRAILACHAMAHAVDCPADSALCHAVGQACSVVHTKGHAAGLPAYELTAIVLEYGLTRCRGPVEARKQEYMERLLYWRDNASGLAGKWAPFL